METKKYFSLTATIFALIALLHGWRFVNNWPAMVAGLDIPLWWSAAAFLVAGYLAVTGWRLLKK
ncbi:MAG: hypothetical protein AAB468_01330 [Patescibacteria group bacterium]